MTLLKIFLESLLCWLIQTSITFGYLKLTTGEEIVAKIEEVSPTPDTKNSPGFRATRPMKIVVMPTREGMQVTLLPWINSVLPTADVSYYIDSSFVISHGECDPELAKSYTQQTTGIAL